MTTNAPIIEDETIEWEENPSHWNQAGSYFLGGLLIAAFGLGIILILITYLKISYTRYRLSNQRLIISRGIFSRSMETIELYRIKDLQYHASFWQRMVGIGNIILISSDKSNPQIGLIGFKDASNKFHQIRSLVENARIKRGVREIDQNDRIE
jgi:membrane protein YdbS with pleckstrin-like domain